MNVLGLVLEAFGFRLPKDGGSGCFDKQRKFVYAYIRTVKTQKATDIMCMHISMYILGSSLAGSKLGGLGSLGSV